MMGIKVPETCWAYYKCNKPFSGIWLVFLLYAYGMEYKYFRQRQHNTVEVRTGPTLYDRVIAEAGRCTFVRGLSLCFIERSQKLSHDGTKRWQACTTIACIFQCCSVDISPRSYKRASYLVLLEAENALSIRPRNVRCALLAWHKFDVLLYWYLTDKLVCHEPLTHSQTTTVKKK